MNSIRSRTLVACLAGFLVVVLAMIGSAAGQSTTTLVFRGKSYPIATSGTDFFSVGDVAHALGLAVSRDPRSGVLMITAEGHVVVVPPAAALIPIDQRSVEISKPTLAAGGALSTQVVIRESGTARFLPRLTESGMHIQWLAPDV